MALEIAHGFNLRKMWIMRLFLLEEKLVNLPWSNQNKSTMFDFYCEYYRPFGQMLVNMERRGITIRATDYLSKVQIQAEEDRELHRWPIGRARFSRVSGEF